MRLSILSAFAAAALLAACSSDVPVNDAGGAGSGAQTAGTTDSSGITQYAPGSKEQFDAEVGNTVYFDYDSYSLTSEAQSQLQRQGAWLQQFPAATLTIEGHCDERGTREYNLALGERRANAVANYLVALGVNSNRLSVISYGKERPLCVQSDESCWSQNRRGVSAINQ
ncbi:peptidoglycan-associated lipoprotein [Dongia mobilis]|uniref:Peptidoglycan-associated lipoprotein n=1 Tax=Dongia mobilis TaxID=578943 RepID=A0A4R6WNB2_9PROT|nr:peptidoglycan-associated lipoprotein Pal [Dongia mobilis]TDQ77629.1 peptidoglycan-associated lipoprotein [Dongia mobilis]